MAKALLKFTRLSSKRGRLIAKQVQGMNADEAIAALDFMPHKAAKVISKVVASAVANGGFEAEEVLINSCRVDRGPIIKRSVSRARGRATPRHKPTSHIFVEVKERGAN